jgi:hypothetical protein
MVFSLTGLLMVELAMECSGCPRLCEADGTDAQRRVAPSARRASETVEQYAALRTHCQSMSVTMAKKMSKHQQCGLYSGMVRITVHDQLIG